MTTPPRRLRFAVGSSLLTASLSLAGVGCTGKQTTEPEPNKQQKQDPPDTVNEGPEPEPKPEVPTHTVNEGPEPKPEPNDTAVDPPEPELHVNPGPDDLEPPPEPKHVNTRPDAN